MDIRIKNSRDKSCAIVLDNVRYIELNKTTTPATLKICYGNGFSTDINGELEELQDLFNKLTQPINYD